MLQKEKIKIACIDNMNNNMFCVARYLRDFGYSADVFVTSSTMAHFDPSADSYDDSYKEFVYSVNWDNLSSNERKIEVKNKLNQYDLIFGCGYVPAYLSEINRRLDFFLPYGGDVNEIPKHFFDVTFFQTLVFKRFERLKKLFYSIPTYLNNPFRNGFYKLELKKDQYLLAKHQINGIRNAKVTFQLESNALTEYNYSKIKSNSKRMKVAFPFIYAPNYSEGNIASVKNNSIYFEAFKKIRDEFDLVIFHHTRHQWKTSLEESSWKGNDKLITAFAEFIMKSNRYNACLILFEYGSDVEASKSLIKELNIEKHIRWFSTMPRKDIMIGLSMSDIGASEFSISWIMGGTIYETLCSGKPLFHYLDESMYERENIFPHVSIKTPQDITNHLLNYVQNPEYYINLGKEGKEWFLKNAIEKPLKIINNEIIEACSEANLDGGLIN